MERFVTATVPSVIKTIENTIPEYMDAMIENFIPNGLISFGGSVVPKKKLIEKEKYLENICKTIEKTRKYKKLNLMIDSGGFQIIVGDILLEDADKFLDYYTTFLRDYGHLFDEAFTLDLASVFEGGHQELYDKNLNCLTKISEIGKNIKKLLFITQYDDYIFFDAWKKIIYEDPYIMDRYNMYSMSGLSFVPTLEKNVPVSHYSIGLSLMLCRLIELKVKGKRRWHVLGTGSPKQIFILYLIKEIVKAKYGIEFLVSYDTSATAKKVMVGRFFEYFNEKDNSVIKVNLRYKELNKRIQYMSHKTNKTILMEEIYKMADLIKLDKNSISDKIYESEKGTFCQDIRPLITVIDNYEQMKIDNYLQTISKQIVKNYLKDDNHTLDEIYDVIFRLNHYSNSKECHRMAKRYLNTLNFLYADININKVTEYMNKYKFLMDHERDLYNQNYSIDI